MIAFGICIGSEEKYERCALPGLTRTAEPDAPVAESTGNRSILTAYNEILDAFADRDDLEALVLLHEDVELRDADFNDKVRRALSDPAVAVLGAVGARAVPGLEWWQGEGVGRCDETRGTIEFGEREGLVDAVDGLLLVLSPWAVRHLRFDEETFSGFHAYDLDLCFQARAAGREVRVVDVDLFHHTKGGFGDEVGFRLADAAFRAKWSLPAAATVERADCPVCGTRLVAGPRHEQYEVALCPSCALGATLPAPSREIASDGIWVEQYGGQRLAMRPQWVREADLRVTWLQLHVPDGRLLEVGSGTGEFCAVAQAYGFDAHGVEPSGWAAEQARELGASVMTGDLDAWRAAHPGETVDAVAAFHVFEHVHEPRPFLRAAREVLAADGALVLEVPCFDSVLARRRTFEWVASALTDHVYHYTAKGLSALLREEGFDVEVVLPFSSRVYDPVSSWQAKRDGWRSVGVDEAPLDMLRVVARRTSEVREAAGPAALDEVA